MPTIATRHIFLYFDCCIMYGGLSVRMCLRTSGNNNALHGISLLLPRLTHPVRFLTLSAFASFSRQLLFRVFLFRFISQLIDCKCAVCVVDFFQRSCYTSLQQMEWKTMRCCFSYQLNSLVNRKKLCYSFYL